MATFNFLFIKGRLFGHRFHEIKRFFRLLRPHHPKRFGSSNRERDEKGRPSLTLSDRKPLDAPFHHSVQYLSRWSVNVRCEKTFSGKSRWEIWTPKKVFRSTIWQAEATVALLFLNHALTIIGNESSMFRPPSRQKLRYKVMAHNSLALQLR
jgi:hypothetical protein